MLPMSLMRFSAVLLLAIVSVKVDKWPETPGQIFFLVRQDVDNDDRLK